MRPGLEIPKRYTSEQIKGLGLEFDGKTEISGGEVHIYRDSSGKLEAFMFYGEDDQMYIGPYKRG